MARAISILAVLSSPILAACSGTPGGDASRLLDIRDVPWVGVWFDGLSQTGVYADIGVEFIVPRDEYLGRDGHVPPCKLNGPHHAACEMPGSYYKHEFIETSGDTSFPHGIFIENENNGYHHGWANNLSRVDVEIWPKLNGANHPDFGAVRIDTAHISHYANGGVYTNHIGRVFLPERESSPYLNGYVTIGGQPLSVGGADTLEIVGFQANDFPQSTTRFPFQSLFAVGVSANDGYYMGGPTYPGRYNMTLVHRRNGVEVSKVEAWLDLYVQGERVDLDLSRHCFGLPDGADALDRCKEHVVIPTR